MIFGSSKTRKYFEGHTVQELLCTKISEQDVIIEMYNK